MSSRYMLSRCTAYPDRAKSSVLSPGGGEQLRLFSAKLMNRSGVNNDLALFIKLDLSSAGFGTLDATLTPDFTDQLANIIANNPVSIIPLVAGDGFLVQAKKPFSLIGMHVSQAETGAPAYVYEYFDGVSFVAIPEVIKTPDFTAIGDTLMLFLPPLDWVAGTDAAIGGDALMYSIRVTTSAAPLTDVQIDELHIGSLVDYQPMVPNNGSMLIEFELLYPLVLDALEEFMPYFDVPSVKNMVITQHFSQS